MNVTDVVVNETKIRIIKDLIDKGELLRERGKISAAVDYFEVVILTTHSLNLLELKAAAMQQLIICYKHWWQNKGKEFYLERMMAIINQGLAMHIPDSAKAGFYLRRADVSAARNYFEEALGDYQLAYEMVEKGGHTQAEFLGHLAEYEAKLGAGEIALMHINEAISMMWKIKTPEKRWHKWIILSGMYGRKAIIQKSLGSRQSSAVSFSIGYAMAWWLLIRYLQGQRLKQAHLKLRGKNV